MLNSHLEHTHEDNDHKGINFFQYKRNIESLTNQFIENKGFLDQDQMKEFIYNQNQENPDGIIMEVNTGNVGGPGMIEVIDQADISYMKAFSQNPYAELIKELQVLSMHENTVKYFEKYILSELQNKNAEKIILVFATDKEISGGPESIGLDSGYSDYIPLKAFQKLIKYKKNKLDTTLIMNYGLSYTYRAHKNYEVFLKTFQDRYLNQENEAFSSKLWSNILGREDLTGRCISKKNIKEKCQDDENFRDKFLDTLEQSYIAKEPFVDGGKGIYFPGERNFTALKNLQTRNEKTPVLHNYVLQKFHELPRKISLENGGQIVSKAVDVRAFVTFNPEHQTIDIQLFGREGNIGKVSNVSSGGKFTKIYTVPDVSYYGIQKKINDLISTLGDSQNNAIEKYFDDYARKNFKVLPEAKIAHIPFVLSESGTIRIVNLVQKLVHNMVDVSFIKRNSEGWIIGNTVIGVDISVNPLPKD